MKPINIERLAASISLIDAARLWVEDGNTHNAARCLAIVTRRLDDLFNDLAARADAGQSANLFRG